MTPFIMHLLGISGGLLRFTIRRLLVHYATKNGGHLVPNPWQSLVELIHDFVHEQIGGAVF
jgi:F0F1-type ATP synthase membrane subunit a